MKSKNNEIDLLRKLSENRAVILEQVVLSISKQTNGAQQLRQTALNAIRSSGEIIRELVNNPGKMYGKESESLVELQKNMSVIRVQMAFSTNEIRDHDVRELAFNAMDSSDEIIQLLIAHVPQVDLGVGDEPSYASPV